MFKFFDRKRRVLHRHGSKSDETHRKFTDDVGNVTVQKAGDLGAILRLRPVAEHHRHSGKHLNIYAGGIAFLDPLFRAPAVFLNVTKRYAVVTHHPRAARLVMVERDKPAITKLVLPTRNIARQNMCVNVDL